LLLFEGPKLCLSGKSNTENSLYRPCSTDFPLNFQSATSPFEKSLASGLQRASLSSRSRPAFLWGFTFLPRSRAQSAAAERNRAQSGAIGRNQILPIRLQIPPHASILVPVAGYANKKLPHLIPTIPIRTRSVPDPYPTRSHRSRSVTQPDFTHLPEMAHRVFPEMA
jgi:hypothetical protein